MSGIAFHKNQWNSGIRSQEWRNGYLEIQYHSLLSCMFEHLQNKTLSKMSDAECSSLSAVLIVPAKPPILPRGILGSFLLASPVTSGVIPASVPTEHPAASSPTVGIWTNISSWPQMASQLPQSDPVSIFFPGTWFLDVATKKNPTEMSWLLPLNSPHPWEQVFPILTMTALWARCFHWLPNSSSVRISQTVVPSGQSAPEEWKATRVGGIIILLIINGKAGTNKQLYGF